MPALRRTTALALLVALVIALFGAAQPALAASVDPVFVAGNPSCTELGYDFGFKPQPEPPPSGVYTFPGTDETVTITSDGINFDWSSTIGIDAVIVKGGPNANVYIYDPPAESFGDTGLHSPINPSNGNPFGISHIEFCYDWELIVSKDAEGSYDRTITWDLDKWVSLENHTGFAGDSFVSTWTVDVTKNVVEDNYQVNGTITIDNPSPFAVSFDVSDVIDGSINAEVTCPSDSIPAGESVECTYSADEEDGVDGTQEENVATVTSNTAGVDGGSDSADIEFTAVVSGDESVTVDDDRDTEDQFPDEISDSTSYDYEETFYCSTDLGTYTDGFRSDNYPNTATVIGEETDLEDSADVDVDCYALEVTKDAATSLTRTWTWTIVKTADEDSLTLASGQEPYAVNYEVTVSALDEDSEHAVSGSISVYNPATIDAVINSVSDIVSPNIAAVVDNCTVDDVAVPPFPYTLAAGKTLVCDYSADLPDDADRTNTATATLQNYDYDSEGTGTANGTTDFTGTANVDFDTATVDEIDECIDVTDTNLVSDSNPTGSLGTVCAGDADKTFNYPLTFGDTEAADVQLECGEHTHTNTAAFVTNDTGDDGSDDWDLDVNIACATGCTLTQGYWKTHSSHGPAPTDDAWYALGDADGDGVSEGADETFFLSGKTYYQVLWTPPAGNAYYNLAHQYIAAKLNILNGATSTPAVNAAIAAAETFFATKTPTSTLTRAQRNAVLANAATLDGYNNGVTGPGHCSEQSTGGGESIEEDFIPIFLPLIGGSA